jgi:hypothetical protein
MGRDVLTRRQWEMYDPKKEWTLEKNSFVKLMDFNVRLK